MQRLKPGARNGYGTRCAPRRPRNEAGPQPSTPGRQTLGGPYGLRMRNASSGSWATLVRRMREATGMSGAELARRLDVDRATIWRWENGKQKPERADIVKAFADIFAIDMEDALRAAGLRPSGEPIERPQPPMDPDVVKLLAILADPDTKPEVKMQVRAMMRALLELAESTPRTPHTPRRRRETS